MKALHQLSCFALCAFLLSMVKPLSGQVYLAGDTYLYEQQPGSIGRTISRDQTGWVHVVWSKANNTMTSRHVFYNIWDSNQSLFVYPGGQQVDNSFRANSVTQATNPDGFCFPAFQSQQVTNSPIRVGAAIDFLPQLGAFSAFMIPPVGQTQYVNPKIAMTVDTNLHVVSREMMDNSMVPCRIFYSRGTPVIDMAGIGEGIDWQNVSGTDKFLLIDSTNNYSHTIAASQTGNRVAIAWTRAPSFANPPYDNDLFISISEDGGLNWQPKQNITNFIRANDSCYCENLNARCCNRDTLRAFQDISLLMDEDDNLHIAFTTVAYYRWNPSESSPAVRRDRSIIWHWDEASQGFHRIAEYWPNENGVNYEIGLLSQQAMIEHPSLSIDPVTGYLYCSYLRYDTLAHLPGAELHNADVFLSRSTDIGLHWTEGVNITNTPPGNGQNQNEQDPSTALNVSNGQLDLQYLIHHSADYPFPGDPAVPSEVFYHRVLVDNIAYGAVQPDRPFHIEVFDCDTFELVLPVLLSVSQDLCDSVVIQFTVPSAEQYHWIRVLRNDVHLVDLEFAAGDTVVWSDIVPLMEPADYEIAAYSEECGEMFRTDPVNGSIYPPPGMVTNFIASDNHWQCITLTWRDLDDANVVSYTIYRDSVLIHVEAPGIEEFVDCDPELVPGDYFYSIVASNTCDGPPSSEMGSIIPPNGGSAVFSLVSAGPPVWDYELVWIEGCVSRLTIYDLCPGTTGATVDMNGWTVTNSQDSVVFETLAPLCEGGLLVGGFQLINSDPNCVGIGRWTAGTDSGTVAGPLPVNNSIPLPDEYSLSIYPNPFNPSTQLEFALPELAEVQILVFDITGRLVEELANGSFVARTHRVTFDASSLPSGLYFARIQANNFTATRKLMLVK